VRKQEKLRLGQERLELSEFRAMEKTCQENAKKMPRKCQENETEFLQYDFLFKL
jgi:hypothetical protein